ncbi:MAG: outer membrane protein [Legionellales bacterium]
MQLKSLAWFVLLLTTVCAQAGVMGDLASSAAYYKNFEISAAGGVAWYQVADADLVISPFETDRNTVNHISMNGAWKAGLGYYLFKDRGFTSEVQQYLNHFLLEVNAYQTKTTLTGSVWQFDIPAFNNYSFSAPITSTRLMFDFKPNLFTWWRVSSYALLGVGATWNTVSYNETVTGAGVSPASALSFSNNTTTQVAWDVGAGLRVAITDNLSATAEYVYAFLGHGAPANGLTNDGNLTTAPRFSLQAQSLLLGFSLKL